MEFSELEVFGSLRYMEDKTREYLKENNMLEDFMDYPMEDISRILFSRVLDFDNFIIIDYGLRNYDLSAILGDGSLVGWFIEWPICNYEAYLDLTANRIAAEEKNNLKEIVSAGSKHKNNGRL
ncbi:hypothetical protein [Pantoea dispersa]|uniref:hypothetical protein n=1 Tax=Pantoea dispersa TaxID=59814 RepID=UPI0024AF673F|nr:hypothetical protein [Pantoea dispersa]MDI6637257.1 hypothetical protein [Pantoea dispersa]